MSERCILGWGADARVCICRNVKVGWGRSRVGWVRAQVGRLRRDDIFSPSLSPFILEAILSTSREVASPSRARIPAMGLHPVAAEPSKRTTGLHPVVAEPSKRRRLVASKEPTSEQDKEACAAAAGDDPSESKGKTLVCEDAQRVLQRYSLGPMRVALKELGVSPLNRPISGTHVHALGRRIISVEGFVVWRYRHGWAHEPNPEDPLEVARYTNRVARATPLLAPVPMVSLKGSIAKTHLLSFLQCLKAGSIYWSDTKQLMVPPAGQAALLEHLEHGMFFEMFSHAAVTEERAALLALAQADNFDSAFALGETEVTLLRSIHASLAVVRPPVGGTAWDRIKEITAESCGQRWSEEDVIAIYNFAKVIGETHLDFLVNTVGIHAPWDEIAVRPSDFHLAAKISASLPWLKIALLTAQYFPPDGRVTKGPFGKIWKLRRRERL